MNWRVRMELFYGLLFPLNRIFAKAKAKLKAPCVRFYMGSTIKNTDFEGYNPVRYHAFLLSCHVGEGTYVFDHAHLDKTWVGRYSSISDRVRVCLGTQPSWGFVNTSPTFLFDTTPYMGHTIHKGKENRNPMFDEAAPGYGVVIGNDVWIGPDTLIMDGVTIGDGAIVMPGSIVARDIEPFSIVSGIPASLKRKRFTDEQIEFLLKFKWWDKGIDWVRAHYWEMDDIEEFMERYLPEIGPESVG